MFDWNWAEAEREIERAIQLNPNVANIHFTYGISYLVPVGRMDEAITELLRAIELEPLSLILNSILSEVYLFARQNVKALDQARKAFDLNPNFGTARFWLGHALLAHGMNEESIDLCESGLQHSPANLVFLYIAGQSYARSGQQKRAEQVIEKIRAQSEMQYVQPYSLARIYTELGDKDKAFVELQKAFEQRDWWVPRLKTDPLMDSLRDDPRYLDLLKGLGLPE
jgi:tetratricopeptide (TPR) repeat protein